MARKKKPTRKYKPKNEFRYNNSKSGAGHPNYVFGETNTSYKSLSITHSPDKRYKHVQLQNNPNPKDGRNAYLELKPKTARKEYYSVPLSGWNFSKPDMAVVRHTTKKYKKAMNRHKKRK